MTAADFPDMPVLNEFFAELPEGRFVYTSPCRSVRVVLDSDELEWYVEAQPFASPDLIEVVLDRIVVPMGFELIPEHESEPEITQHGWVLIRCIPIVDGYYDSGELESDQLTDAGRIGVRATIFATAGLLLASPFASAASDYLGGVFTN